MERIPGGKARGGRCPRNVDKAELAQGIKVELEHTNDRRVAREIACDHLTEDGRYYSKLATVHLDGGRRLGASGSAAMDEGRRKALLAKPVRFEGRQMTKAQMIEEMVRRGGMLKPDRFPKYDFSRTKFNRMGRDEQAAYEEKMKIKMPFAVELPNGVIFEITQTEADYFKSLGGQLGAPRARRALGNPAAPTFTVYERNEMTGHANYVGTFASQADAQAYVDRQVARSRKFATFEVWTGTPKAPRKPVPGTTARGLHGVTDPRRGEAYNLDVAALRKGDTLDDFGTIVRVAKVNHDGTISLEVRAKGPFGVKWYPDRRLKPHAMAHMRTVRLDGDDLAGGRRQVTRAASALPTLPEAEHAEWTAAQAVTAALRSRDPAKIAQAKAALATANEATFQAWGRLPAAERLRRRAAGTAPDGM